MPLDYSKLKGRIIERFGSQKDFAKAMELSERSLSIKMNNEAAWKQSEILKAVQLLGISESEIAQYFFTLKVQNV
ncbi:MAG: DUF739 family protein [Firmicutes bacterium]|nr:DUF739 family protein [Bacillota bacterium]